MIENGQHSAALDALKSLLAGEERVSHALVSTIEEAIGDIEKRLEPISKARLTQILSRLTLHFKCPPGKTIEHLFEEYLHKLAHYPEDLLSAAYTYVVKHARGIHLPSVEEIIAFIEPEFLHRKETIQKLGALHQQSVQEGVSHEPA